MPARITAFLHRHRSLLLFIGLMVVFRSSFADWYTVPTPSMNPTIIGGDRIVVNKLAYDLKLPLSRTPLARLGEPQRGDIVVFDSVAADTRLIKRVIGVPGDSVALVDNRLIVNGEPARYDQTKSTAAGLTAIEQVAGHRRRVTWSPAGGRLSSFAPVTVPPEHYLVLGDNRDNSADSRVYGFVPRAEIAGRAGSVAFSVDYDRYYLLRTDRFIRDLQRLPQDGS